MIRQPLILQQHVISSTTIHQDYIRPQTLFGTKFESYLNEKAPEKGDLDNADKYQKIDFGSIPGRDEKA